MRALNIRTRRLESIDPSKVVYIALSHTWDDHEPTYQDFIRDPEAVLRLPKIHGLIGLVGRLAEEVVLNGVPTIVPAVNHVWIDTICIDKTSSAELQEAINSMYGWYEEACACFAYLSDVHLAAGVDCGMGDVVPAASRPVIELQFRSSRWFRRGWTLQELLAPRHARFFTSSWQIIGSKDVRRGPSDGDEEDLVPLIASTTGIPPEVLRLRCPPLRYSVAERMSWACGRQTTRPEDEAYCLMGLFDVNMPMLYGEGGAAAFARLVGEIAKRNSDHSLFAYGFRRNDFIAGPFYSPYYDGIVVPTWTVSDYRGCGLVKNGTVGLFALPTPDMEHFTITNRGVHIELAVLELPAVPQLLVGLLNCSTEVIVDNVWLTGCRVLAVPLLQQPQPGTRSKLVVRRREIPLVDLPLPALESVQLADSRRHTPIMTTRQLYITDRTRCLADPLRLRMQHGGFDVCEVYPPPSDVEDSVDGKTLHIPESRDLTHAYIRLWCEALGTSFLIEVVTDTSYETLHFEKLGVAAMPSAYESLLECLVCKDLGADRGYPEVVFENPAKLNDRFFITARGMDRTTIDLDVQTTA